MNKDLVVETVAFAVRLVADRTDLIQKPDTFTATIDTLFGADSYDVKLAKKIVSGTTEAAAFASKLVINRKFKKIVQNV